ncbi:MAG: hypothetical protein ABIT08_05010 [Bacteroidia bacterium]
MKKENGEIVFIYDFDEDGNKIETVICHPELDIDLKDKSEVCWKQYSGKIVTKNGIEITAYKLSKLPHAIKLDNEWKRNLTPETYSTEQKEYVEKNDFRSNCLGDVLADNNIWLKAGREKDIFKVILENDGYTCVDKDEIVPNTIALFKKENSYKHAAKTNDGIIWICKSGINKEEKCTIEVEAKKWGVVEYYKKLD